MPKLNWDGNDFRNSQDSSGTVADNISRNGNLQQGYEHGSLTKGLVAYYPMEKGEGEILHDGALDNLGQIKPGSSGDNTTVSDMWTTGKVGSNALEFDGKDDEVDLGDISLFNEITDAFAVSVWFRTSSSEDQAIFNNANYNENEGWQLRTDSGDRVQFEYYDTSNGNIQPDSNTSGLNDGQWHHFVVTFDANDNFVYYIDGSEDSIHNCNEIIDNTTTNPRIGAMKISGYDRPFQGKIGDVKIYNRTLSKPEIKALYNEGNGIQSGVERTESSVPSQSEGGISRYKLDGDATDTWGDKNGTNNGADLTATGIYGQAGDFDGSNHIETPTIIDFSQGTVCTWIKIDNSGLGDDKAIFSSRPSKESERFYFRKNDGDKIELWMDDAWSKSPFIGDKILSEDTWYHILITWNGAQEKLYINGDLDKQESNGWTPNGTLSNSIGARNRDGSHDFNFIGKIDDVRIYDKALTPLQVEKLYHKGAYRISRESILQ